MREWLGSGTLTLPGLDPIPVMPAGFVAHGHAWVLMILPPGAFLTLGIVVGLSNQIRARRSKGGAA